MTTQSTIIINFHDDKNNCNSDIKDCNYLIAGRCSIRVVKPKLQNIEKFCELALIRGRFQKTSTCRFLWEKENKK